MFSLCHVKSLVCVMCTLQSVLCVAFSVSSSPLKRLVAALLIPADTYVYIYVYISIYPRVPMRAWPVRPQGGLQGPGPQGPMGPTRARPKRAQGAHKGPGGPQGPGPQAPRNPQGPGPQGPTEAALCAGASLCYVQALVCDMCRI